MEAAETNVLLTLLMLLSWGTSKPMLLVYLLSSTPPAGQPPLFVLPILVLRHPFPLVLGADAALQPLA